MNPDKAKQGGGGIEAGNYEVTKAVYQNIKTDHRDNQLYLSLTVATLDKDGERVRDADLQLLNLSAGGKSLESFHPGNASGPDDAEPEDMGDEPDAQGNTIFCVGDEQFNKACSMIVFAESLAKQGYPKAMLERTWAPDFVGLKFTLDTLDPKQCNEKFGTRLNTRPSLDKKTGEPIVVTYKVATRWLNPKYLDQKASGKNASSKAVTPTKKAAAVVEDDDLPSKPAAGKSAAAAGGKNGSAEISDIFKRMIASIAATKAGSTIKSKTTLTGYVNQAYAKAKLDMKKLPLVQAVMNDDDAVIEAVLEAGGSPMYGDDGEWTGEVEFPTAE
jgi:hypothetical protein